MIRVISLYPVFVAPRNMAHRSAICPYRALAHASVIRTRGSFRRTSSANAWRRPMATPLRAGEGDSGVDSPKKPAPWALMGRSVHEHHMGLSKEAEDELALGAVADESGVPLECLRSNLTRLEQLCPPLVTRRKRGELKPAFLVRLALDLDQVTQSMMRLKILLPNADVAEMCSKKPALFQSTAVDRAYTVAEKVRMDYTALFAEKASEKIKNNNANALLTSVPDILLVASDTELVGIIARTTALHILLPNADIAQLAGKRPEFLLTSDAGHSSNRGGHAAGLEAGRSYEPGVPKRKRKDKKRAEQGGIDESIETMTSDNTSKGTSKQSDPEDEAEIDLETWHVAKSIAEMKNRLPPDCDVDRLLTDFPNILAMDVPALFQDLEMVFPTREAADVLRRDPKIAYQVRTKDALPMFFHRNYFSPLFGAPFLLSTSALTRWISRSTNFAV